MGEVTTIAGSGQPGLLNGTSNTATFSSPYGVAVAQDGTIYVADTNNHCIRKISQDTGVTTLAGDGSAGFKDGNGMGAKLNSPFSIAIDNQGDLVVADTGNNRIRRVTKLGQVTTISGSTSGYKDGPAGSALFSLPNDVTVAPNGDIFVADFQNHSIRRISVSNLAVSTFAGNGTAGKSDGVGQVARFNSPTGLHADVQGNLYIADNLNFSIRKISSEGAVTTLAGGTRGFLDGPLFTARFDEPADVVSDVSGNLYVVDTQNHCIRKVKL